MAELPICGLILVADGVPVPHRPQHPLEFRLSDEFVALSAIAVEIGKSVTLRGGDADGLVRRGGVNSVTLTAFPIIWTIRYFMGFPSKMEPKAMGAIDFA
ncbi:MAG: hypothetical protein IPM41_06910 [Sphingomonadales bacterium]|nr:hypothetical protein [Sphingomonadales bacterium]